MIIRRLLAGLGAAAVTVRALLVGVGAAAVAIALMLGGVLEKTELTTLNQLFVLRGARPVTAPIVIVTIDEDSFDELDLAWPFPRALHGRLIETLSAARPVAIGLDVLFSEPSLRGPEDDEAFGASILRVGKTGHVVLGAALATVTEVVHGLKVDKADYKPPLPIIREGAAGVGPVDHTRDSDAHIRRSPLLHMLPDDTFVDSWDVQIYRIAKSAGLPAAPLPDVREVLVNFRGGPHTFPWVPYHRVVNGEVPPEQLRGKIILVGPTSPLLQDLHSTPFAEAQTMPGVEVHANVLDTLLHGDRLRPVPAWVSVVIAALLALGSAWLVAEVRALRAVAVAGLAWVLLIVWTYVAFAYWNVWFRVAGVTVGLVLGYGATVVDSFIREQREKRRLSQFFSPDVLREIVKKPGATLGSSRRVISVLFSDIRGFTSISERIPPEQVAEMLHEYLTEMTQVVFHYGGTVDKYIGDCIMALYNAPFDDPDHAANAIQTGLELQERTLAVSARWEEKLGAPIRNGVGIHTGEAVVGTLGSRQRLEYTAIGDTVNLASRLEGLTKDHGGGIVISEFTYELVKDRFLMRQLGAVAVKGKTRPVRIYAVLPGDIRKYPRVAVAAAATVVAIGGGEPCVVRMRNVGAGGISVTGLPADWGHGTKIQIRLEGGKLPTPLVVDGAVAWRDGDVAGVAFAEPGGDVSTAITTFMES
jgi:adenylate cyclase